MASELELVGPTLLRVERTQLVVVTGKGTRRHAQAVPLDMVHSVAFGHHMAHLGIIMAAVVALLVGFVLFWLAPMPLEPWIYAAAGILMAGVLTGLFFLQGGHRLTILAGPLALQYPCKKAQLPQVQTFARDLMTRRVGFIEGMYGEEE